MNERCTKLKAHLIALGYPPDHRFIQSLEKDDTSLLNTADEKDGLTPLRLAIFKDPFNLERICDLSEFYAGLNQYEAAVLMRALGVLNQFENLNVATHLELVNCFQALYPTISMDNGFCFGITHMARQAFLTDEMNVFYDRLYKITYTLLPIVEKAMQEVEKSGTNRTKQTKEFFDLVRQKVQPQVSHRLWHDVYEFFDGVVSYANPEFLKDMGVLSFANIKAPTQTEMIAESLLTPVQWKQQALSTHTPMVFGVYDKARLARYFECLHEAFKDCHTRISFEVTTPKHAIAIHYVDGKFFIQDPNKLRCGCTPFTSDSLAGFMMNDCSNLILSTRAFISPDTEAGNQQLFTNAWEALQQNEQWKKIHSITQERVMIQDSSNCTLLYIVAQQGCIEVVNEILNISSQNTAKLIEHTNRSGVTPLWIAAQNGHLEVVQAFMNSLNPEDKKALIEKPNNNGRTPLWIAAQEGHLEVVLALMNSLNTEDKKALIEKPNNNGITPLWIAAQEGHLEVVQAFMNSLNTEDKKALIEKACNEVTPLWIAAQHGHFQVVRALINSLDNTQDKKALIEKVCNGVTPLWIAAQNGHLEVVRVLMNSLNPEDKKALIEKACNEVTPLWIAAQNGHFKVVQALIDSLTNEQDKREIFNAEFSPNINFLNQTAENIGRKSELTAFLAKHPAIKFTPLYGAVFFGHTKIVELFLNQGALLSVESKTIAYKMAIAMDRKDIVELYFNQNKNEIQRTFIKELSTLNAKSESFSAVQGAYKEILLLQETFFSQLTVTLTSDQLNKLIKDFSDGCEKHIQTADAAMEHGWLYRVLEVTLKAIVGLFVGLGMVFGSVCGQGLAKKEHRDAFKKTFMTLDNADKKTEGIKKALCDIKESLGGGKQDPSDMDPDRP